MLGTESPTSVLTNTTCNHLLRQLQQIWSDIGESEAEQDRMLVELEREFLEVYRRKFDEASNCKARLHHSVAAREAELATLMAALGEHNTLSMVLLEKKQTSLKEQLALVTPLVEELKVKKEGRMKQFADIKAQIEKINGEITGYGNAIDALNLDEQDLSLRNLSEYESHLRTLQKEKAGRLQKVLGHVNEVHSLCGILGLDFGKTVSEVHPSLQGTNIEQCTNMSDNTIEGLEQAILRLKTERKIRLQTLKEIVVSLFELWNLMGSTREEKNKFSRITSILGMSEPEIVEPGTLSMDIINQASAEVDRLTKLKASRMKELVIKKRLQLEEICCKTHIEPDRSTVAEKSIAMIDSGLVDPCSLLANIESQINKVKDEALSRKDIMDRIERWLSACDEENWLEDYNQDENRYSAGKGAHVNLKRAERARIAVTKIPSIVDCLIYKTLTWEDENRKLFLYDGVRLVSILEDYKVARQQKEEDKKRQRDQKKIQDMLLTERELIYGSKPSPRKSNSLKKTNGYHHQQRGNGNGSPATTPRRNSIGCTNQELMTPRSYPGRRNNNNENFKEMRRLTTVPLNFVSMAKEDTISFSSLCGSEPESPPQC